MIDEFVEVCRADTEAIYYFSRTMKQGDQAMFQYLDLKSQRGMELPFGWLIPGASP